MQRIFLALAYHVGLNYIHVTAAIIVWVYLYLILRKCFRKPRKDVQDER